MHTIDPFDPPSPSEYRDDDDWPSRTTLIGGRLHVIPLTDPDDLIDYYEAMREPEDAAPSRDEEGFCRTWPSQEGVCATTNQPT